MTGAIGGAVAVAGVAWRRRSLDATGAAAACVVGAVALRTSLAWGLYLIAWFVLAAVWSHLGRRAKTARTAGIVAKPGARDAWQVLANGGVFAACAVTQRSLATSVSGSWHLDAAWLSVAAAGALTAAGADTWSTELGTWRGGTPWSLRTGTRVPPGTSGAVTWMGTAGGALGALCLAGLAAVVGMVPWTAFPAVAAGGLAGAWVDTLCGAFVQGVRWCPVCAEATECATHPCGTRTVPHRGLRVLENDGVNALCTLIGSVVAVLVWRGIRAAP